MKIENQVCPFEHAKRLKKLGVMQESLHYYSEKFGIVTKTRSGFAIVESMQPGAPDLLKEDITLNEYYAAFTVAELGIALPYSINSAAMIIENGNDIKYVSYPRIKTTFGTTEAQARANMLIWLLDNKYITADEVNRRVGEQVK